MRFLLDTHAFLWFITADPRLSATAEQAIRSRANTPLLGIASVWEMAIKVGLNKLPIPQPIDVFIPQQLRANRVELLPIELPHALEVARLPFRPPSRCAGDPGRNPAGDG